VEITDDDGVDPYFLYLWSVSEEEFHELKQQQRLLVDFQTFPNNLIELLECCLKDSKSIHADSNHTNNSDGGASSDATVDAQHPDENEFKPATVNPILTIKQATSRTQGPVPLR
jgi:hypothetical protein